MDKATHD